MNNLNHQEMSKIYLNLADVIFGVIIAASFIDFKNILVPFTFSFETMMLLVAYIVVVLSWIGYHKAVAEKPHKNLLRFVIDLWLLFFYFYLIFTQEFKDFLIVHAIIFGLYLLWVIIRHKEYPPSNSEKNLAKIKIIRSIITFLASVLIVITFTFIPIQIGIEFYSADIINWIYLFGILALNVFYRLLLPLILLRKQQLKNSN